MIAGASDAGLHAGGPDHRYSKNYAAASGLVDSLSAEEWEQFSAEWEQVDDIINPTGTYSDMLKFTINNEGCMQSLAWDALCTARCDRFNRGGLGRASVWQQTHCSDADLAYNQKADSSVNKVLQTKANRTLTMCNH